MKRRLLSDRDENLRSVSVPRVSTSTGYPNYQTMATTSLSGFGINELNQRETGSERESEEPPLT